MSVSVKNSEIVFLKKQCIVRKRFSLVEWVSNLEGEVNEKD